MRHEFLQKSPAGIHYVEEGEGPTILLLHGFPEFWFGWRRQIPLLAEAGFHVVAPDLRGYGQSAKPEGVDSYRMSELMRDVVALIEECGEEPVVLAGHDWGGVIAWYVAMYHPCRVRKLIVLNAPHPAAYLREIRRFSSQIWRSWYAGFFQLPRLPEWFWRAGDFAMLRRAIARGPASDPEDVERYVKALAGPGVLTAALNYYRALVRRPPPRARELTSPTLLIWGERDTFLVPELTEGLEAWVPDLHVERLPEATHWLHHEEPERIAELIIGFARR